MSKREEGVQTPENMLERIPEGIKYKTFARLNALALASARLVCRDWNKLLSPAALQALALNPRITTSPAFLVRVQYLRENKAHQVYLIVDHHKNFQSIPILNEHYGWDISSNGFLTKFPEYLEELGDEILVFHVWQLWMKIIPLDFKSSFKDREGSWFRGSCFDSDTSNFIILIVVMNFEGADIYLYGSESMQWKHKFQEVTRCMFRNHTTVNGIYHQGCFYWLNEGFEDRGCAIMMFDLKDEKLRTISLPDCPLHSDNQISCYTHDAYCIVPPPAFQCRWSLKGCDGNLVLIHHVNNGDTSTDLVTWKLGKCEWQLVLNLRHASLLCFLSEYCIDKSGWWIWIDPHDDGTMDPVIWNEKTDAEHYIPTSELLSFLDISSDTSAFVEEVWPFETNSLWEMLSICKA